MLFYHTLVKFLNRKNTDCLLIIFAYSFNDILMNRLRIQIEKYIYCLFIINIKTLFKFKKIIVLAV